MSWKELLVSPPPTAGWTLDSAAVAVVRRDRKGLLHCALGAVPPDTFGVGPMGLQSVDRRRLDPALAPLQQQLRGERRVAMVVPTAWIRGHILDFEHLPRRSAEITDVVSWRLKKLLSIPPAELRLSVTAMPAVDGRRQVLCLVGLERALAELEQAFLELGVQVGLLTPRVFALAFGLPPASEFRMVVQEEVGFFSVALMSGSTPRLLRTKPLPPTGELGEMVERELQMVLAYVRTTAQIAGSITATVSASTPELDGVTRAWLARQEGVEVEPPIAVGPCADPTTAALLGPSRLTPLWALLCGGGA